MERNIFFDMDGTIADLYGVEGWLADLNAENARPYREARPLVNMQRLARRLNRLQKGGYKIGVITWLAKNSTADFERETEQAKRRWLRRHLHSVHFDNIIVLQYGTPKQEHGKGILFDDELPNRQAWGEGAYHPDEMFKVLAEVK